MKACCDAAYNHDKRTPGLFKEEFVGKGIIALNPKTYYCYSDDATKKSTKGIMKHLNDFSENDFKKVLFAQETVEGCNKGFLFKNRNMYTYEQHRNGLSYFYAKRKVLDDGVHTIPLDL